MDQQLIHFLRLNKNSLNFLRFDQYFEILLNWIYQMCDFFELFFIFLKLSKALSELWGFLKLDQHLDNFMNVHTKCLAFSWVRSNLKFVKLDQFWINISTIICFQIFVKIGQNSKTLDDTIVWSWIKLLRFGFVKLDQISKKLAEHSKICYFVKMDKNFTYFIKLNLIKN